MLFINRPRSWWAQIATALLLATAIFFANTAQAARVDAIKQTKPATNFNGTAHRQKTVIFNKTRLALKVISKNRLLRLPSRQRLVGRGTAGLNPRLRRLLGKVGRNFGRPVVVTSGCRSYSYNRRIGGARRSMHVGCRAADFKVVGISKARLRRYVASLPGRGGVGTYCGRSIVHLDVGPVRSWYQGCRKRRKLARR